MSSAILTFVVNAAWQASLISVAALLLTRVIRRASVCTVAVALSLLVAMLSVVTGPRSVSPPAKAAVTSGRGPGTTLSMALPAGVALAVTIAELLVIVYGLTTLGIRLRRTRRLVADSRLVGVSGKTELRVAAVAVPSTAGSVILLPEYILGNKALLDAAVAHELAHVRRRDYLANIVFELLTIPLLLHPGIMALRRRAAELREMSCDRAAAAQQGGRSYAQALIAIANLAAGQRSLAMSMADSTVLERRLNALQTTRRSSLLAACTIIALAAALLTTSCRYSVQPAIESQLAGDWTLVPEASRFGPLKPYRSFRQRIAMDGDSITVTQRRSSSRGVEKVAWSVRPDGVTRPVDGIAGAVGSARWSGGRLVKELERGGHYERGVAFLDNDHLVVDGEVRNANSRGSYRFVFRRER